MKLDDKLLNVKLKSIGEVNVTSREVDIISCIVNNRRDKKIASLLFISPNTVRSHARNIMQKLGCNSRETVIDLIEKTGQIVFLRQHYIKLSITTLFKNTLLKVGKLCNGNQLLLPLKTQDNVEIEKILNIQELKKYLSLANVILIDEPKNNKNNQLVLRIHCSIESGSEKIIFSFSSDKSTKTINFQKKDNYYFLVLQLLIIAINKSEIDKIFQIFKADYQGLSQSNIKVNIKKTAPFVNKMKKANFLITLLICLFILGVFIYLIWNSINNSTAKFYDYNNTQLQQSIQSIINDLSINNPPEATLHGNQEWIENAEYIVQQTIFREKNAFSNDHLILPNELLSSLYLTLALASTYLYNEHNPYKARELLLFAKRFAENYVIIKNKTNFDFNTFDYEKVYTQLSVIDSLPEMYTRLVYLIGKTYLYSQNRQTKAKKYLKLSKFLGNKLKLFEGYLSTASELTIYLSEETKSSKELQDVIKLYQKLKEDNGQYKLDYQLSSNKLKFITPKEDVLTQLSCDIQIVVCYAELINITDNTKLQETFLEKIILQFTGNEEISGLFKQINSLKRFENVIKKDITSVYNMLGTILITAYEKKLPCSNFKKIILKELNLSPSDDLELVEQIFKLSLESNRINYYTKNDSYKGLSKIYKKQLTQAITESKKYKIMTKLQKLNAIVMP